MEVSLVLAAEDIVQQPIPATRAHTVLGPATGSPLSRHVLSTVRLRLPAYKTCRCGRVCAATPAIRGEPGHSSGVLL